MAVRIKLGNLDHIIPSPSTLWSYWYFTTRFVGGPPSCSSESLKVLGRSSEVFCTVASSAGELVPQAPVSLPCFLPTSRRDPPISFPQRNTSTGTIYLSIHRVTASRAPTRDHGARVLNKREGPPLFKLIFKPD